MKTLQSPKGRRERNKEDKLRRIKGAAVDLFTRKGYDDTTTREIAARAKVALGTIFVYAETKRDLLFLIVNDDLEVCITEAQRSVESSRQSFLEALLFVLRIHHEHFARTPIISRAALRAYRMRPVPEDANSASPHPPELRPLLRRCQQ